MFVVTLTPESNIIEIKASAPITNGQLVIRRSDSGALVGQRDSFKAVKSGMIDGPK